MYRDEECSASAVVDTLEDFFCALASSLHSWVNRKPQVIFKVIRTGVT